MKDELAVQYLGFALKSPVIIGACPLSIEIETVRRLEEAGAGAVVLPSMLQEQITYRQMKLVDPLDALEYSGYQPQQDEYNGGPEDYLRTISRLKESVAVPIFASLNGVSDGGWLEYAKDIEAAGADALELNLQPTDCRPDQSANEIESHICEMAERVIGSVSIPVAVKLSQRYTNLASMIGQLQGVGARGVVLFSHLPYWDVCVDRMHWTIRWELSPPDALGRILEGLVRVGGVKFDLSIAASGSVTSGDDVIKAMIAGADATMVTSAIYRHGTDVVRKIVEGVRWRIETSPFSTLGEYMDALPPVERPSGMMNRLQYVDPLTRTSTILDPKAVSSRESVQFQDREV